MKKLYSLLGALLVGASLFAQTNYTCTFSANVPMDSVQVKNTVSGEAKMLYYPDNEITLQKVDNQNVAVATVGNSAFLQQTANNIVAVNVETTSLLNLTLYSANGTVVARYANAVSAGQYTFQVGASTGVYVLVASANAQTASLKLSLQENALAGIFEVATAESVAFLKSADDVITFNEGEEFEFTGYYKKQTDIKTSAIIKDEEIIFAFERDYEGAIKFAFSISKDKKVYFSQGNLQYQASTGTWRFAENQWDYVGTQTPDDNGHYGGTIEGSDNANISSTYDGWIDLFAWGTSGWNSKATAYEPYSTSTAYYNYYPGGANSYTKYDLLGEYANADWGVYNAISNGGNQSGLWRTLTQSEWKYLLKSRENAFNRYGLATVNEIMGIILLPDDWTMPNDLAFVAGHNVWSNNLDYTENTYSIEEWKQLEKNGAIFLPAAGSRYGTTVSNIGVYGCYNTSTHNSSSEAMSSRVYYVNFGSSSFSVSDMGARYSGYAVRLVQDVQ